MEIPGLGEVNFDTDYGCYISQPIAVPVLGGKRCRIVVEDYENDRRKAEFHEAIANFLKVSPTVLTEAGPHLFRYYEDCRADWDSDDEEFVEIPSPDDAWRHVRLGSEAIVSRRPYGDKGIYISLTCKCAWEPEHGLQVVFKNGLQVCKVGPYDGHVTNADAYGDIKLDTVVYVARG